MLARARIVVDGLVQGVGYRYAVRSLARAHNLLGYVKNLDDGTVEIVCEGDRKDIQSFADELKVVKEPITVDRVDLEFEEPKQEFKSFRIVTGDLTEEVVEGFATGSAYFNILIGKQDQMLSKQDQTIGEVRALREDLKAFLDERFKRLEREIDQIKSRLGMV